MRLVVTGAGGFVGMVMSRTAEAEGHEVVRVVRRGGSASPGLEIVGEIDGRTDWGDVVDGADVVIHLAARVHVLREYAKDPLAAFRAVNVEGTRRLAEAAATRGVRRLVLVSTIKVLGESTSGTPFRPDDPLAPGDPYAQSKLEAELALRQVSERAGLEVVIVRPPLVHGPGVGGNLRRLMALIRSGVPLPFGGVRNRRSLVGVQNLAALLLRAATVPQAAGQTLLVADQPAISTPALVRLMAESMGRPARLWPLPAGVLTGLARLTGRVAEVERLVGSLEVDDQPSRALLAWTPPHTLEEGIGEMVSAFGRKRTA
ncbi:MAG: NAD-dependent epimerase/dehydratase family protein [Gemmatimonadales bacterium]